MNPFRFSRYLPQVLNARHYRREKILRRTELSVGCRHTAMQCTERRASSVLTNSAQPRNDASYHDHRRYKNIPQAVQKGPCFHPPTPARQDALFTDQGRSEQAQQAKVKVEGEVVFG